MYDEARNTHTHTHTHTQPQSYKTYEIVENATIVPSSQNSRDECNTAIYDEDRNLIISALQHSYNSCPRKYVKAQNYINKEVIYIDFWDFHFGHFVLETLSRLWLANELPTIPIVISATIKGDWQDFHKNILSLLHIENEFIFIHESTLFKKIYIPFPLAKIGNYVTKDYFTFLERYENNSTINKKIYLSRKKYTGKGIMNQLEIDKYAAANGYKIIIPEELELIDLLAELASAEEILTIEGSALYNLLFIKDLEATVHIIPRMWCKDSLILFAEKKNIHFLDVELKIIKKYGDNGSLSRRQTEIQINNLDFALKNKKYANLEEYNFNPKCIDAYINMLNKRKNPASLFSFEFLDILDNLLEHNYTDDERNALVQNAINLFSEYLIRGEAYHKEYTNSLVAIDTLCWVFLRYIEYLSITKQEGFNFTRVKKLYLKYRLLSKLPFKNKNKYLSIKRNLKSILLYTE